jgi:RNA-directed DNA polymerase
VSPKSEDLFKSKLEGLTQRNRGESLEVIICQLTSVMRGWLNYFQHATMKSKMGKIDSWLRRRLKMLSAQTMQKMYWDSPFSKEIRIKESLCWRSGLSGKGWWQLSNSPAISIGINNRWFEEQGYYSLESNYLKLHCNSL